MRDQVDRRTVVLLGVLVALAAVIVTPSVTPSGERPGERFRNAEKRPAPSIGMIDHNIAWVVIADDRHLLLESGCPASGPITDVAQTPTEIRIHMVEQPGVLACEMV